MDYILIGLIIICSAGIIAVLGRGMWKSFGCKMGWHSYKYDVIGFNGIIPKAQCRWCKYKGSIDSQGNLF